MKRSAFLFVILLSVAYVHHVTAQVIVDEDFESYTSDGDLTTAWSGGLATLDTTIGLSGSQSALHPAGTVNTFSAGIGAVNASATQDVVLTGSVYDDALVGNDRISIGLRGGPFPLFEMGRYNSFDVVTTGDFDVYGVRINTIGNGIVTPGDFTPTNGWVAFPDALGGKIPSTEGWHTYKATFSLSGVTVDFDLLSDGVVDSTVTYAGDGSGYGGGFTDLRFGGPSNLSSAGGGANFDDIRLELVTIGGGTLDCDLDADNDCDHDDIDLLYANSPSLTDINTWLADASDTSNPANPNGATFAMGDVNLEGNVNSDDLGLLLNNFGSTSGVNWIGGDLNADSNVNSDDLGLLLNNFNFSSPLAAAVPEPSGFMLASLMLFGLALIQKRK